MIILETRIRALPLFALSSLVASGNEKSMKSKRFLPPGLGTGTLLPSWDYTYPGLGGWGGRKD